MKKLALGPTPDLNRAWLFLSVAALCVLLSVTVHLRLWSNLDLASTLFLQALVPRSMDLGLSVFSLIGSAEVTGLFILAYAAFSCPPSSRILLVVLFVSTALIELIGKNLIYQPGPPHIFYRYVLPFGFPTSGVATPYAFPSGHSARSVFLTFVLAVWIQQSRFGAAAKRMLLGLLVSGEVVMLVSRVSLGEHWSTDVMGGALLATALALPWLYGLRRSSLAVDSGLPRESSFLGD